MDRVRRAWELVLQHVQTGSVSLYAMLRDARPSELRGDDLTVGVPSEFALARAREPGNDEVLAQAIEAVLGRPLRPTFKLAGGASPDTPAPATGPETLDFTTLIKQAKGTFDAEELPDES